MNDFFIVYIEKANDYIEEIARCNDRITAAQVAECNLTRSDVLKVYVCKHYTVNELTKEN